MLDAKLIVVGGEAAASEYQLELPVVIGRGRESGIVIGHPLVSRRHCEIYEVDDQLMVRDLASLNGTFVGREQIHQRVLRPGELLTVGTVTFRAVYNGWSEDDLERLADDSAASVLDDASVLDETTSLAAEKTSIHRQATVDAAAAQPAK